MGRNGTDLVVDQSGGYTRNLSIQNSTKVYFVGLPDKSDHKLTPGYGVKATTSKSGQLKQITFTPPLDTPQPLGSERLGMTGSELYSAVDADADGAISYVEFSRSIEHSPKHGPDGFRKADRNGDGVLDPSEFAAKLSTVPWWILSRKSPDDWFADADRDHNRGLSKTEFRAVCVSSNHIENIFKRADRDKSGQLSAGETADYIRGITHPADEKSKKRKRN
ncbi:MAG: hypothetical protein AAF532_00100 [Planctomycetota bacterium]